MGWDSGEGAGVGPGQRLSLIPFGCRKKSLEGMKKKQQQQAQDSDSDAEDPGISEDPDRAGTSDDDAEYYREAVGEEPDKGESCLTLHCPQD